MLDEFSEVNVLAELEESGWKYEPIDGTEIKCFCPAHEHPKDPQPEKPHTPSCHVNLETHEFHCKSCGQGGSFLKFMSLVARQPVPVIAELFKKKYNIGESTKLVDSSLIEKYHAELWNHPELLKPLYDRGINDDIIREQRYGYCASRITIPVRNKSGEVVNLRGYQPGAPSKVKFKNLKGRGKNRIYRPDQLKYDTIVICGGEVKADATAYRLNTYNIGAISASGGESSWEMEFSHELKGKKVFICLDIDATGVAGAERVAGYVKPFAASVKIVFLPLDKDKYNKGDISDYWGKEKKTPEDFLKLLQEAVEWAPPNVADDIPNLDNPLDVSLESATNPENIGKLLTVSGNISVLDTQPYLVPKVVGVGCNFSSNFCAICPVMGKTPNPQDKLVELTISALSKSMVSLVDVAEKSLNETIRTSLNIPPCRIATFKVKEYHNVFALAVSPSLELTNRVNSDIYQPIYFVGTGLETNGNYRFTGRALPSPKDSKAVILANEAKPTVDSLDTFTPTKSELDELEKFRVSGEVTVSSIAAKLDLIYKDFEDNVTRVYSRRALHLFVDLCYHSVLRFSIDGDLSDPERGWVSILILGDSSQGKSRLSSSLMAFYNLGDTASSKAMSEAGLLGGVADDVSKTSKRRFIKWGLIAKQDRRLLLIEELAGSPKETFSCLTDTRSTGIAQISKIVSARTLARTRLLVVSNTRSARLLSQFNFGVEATLELMDPQDVRRFDAIALVSNKSVGDIQELALTKSTTPHEYTSQLCRNLILWAWTRRPNEIIFTPEARNQLLASARNLTAKFTEIVPIVDKGSIRIKLAKLGIALAARLFSTDKQREKIVVEKGHIQYIEEFLTKEYSSSVYGYSDLTLAVEINSKMSNPILVKREICKTSHYVDFVNLMLSTNEIVLTDIQDWSGYEVDQAKTLLSFLVRSRALVRQKNCYVKTEPFIELLKQMRSSSEFNTSVPEYAQEKPTDRTI